MVRALLSNSSVKTLNDRESVFYGVRAANIAMQWFGKHVSTIETVFSMGSVQRNYLKKKRHYDSVLSSREVRRPVRSWCVIRRLHECVIPGVCDSVRLVVPAF
jgi:hypothetical protein